MRTVSRKVTQTPMGHSRGRKIIYKAVTNVWDTYVPSTLYPQLHLPQTQMRPVHEINRDKL